jgi:hypothetical protein
VSLIITLSRNEPKKRGTELGLTIFAKPYASSGDCDAGVPVIIHKKVLGLMIEASAFQRRVVAVLYALQLCTNQ